MKRLVAVLNESLRELLAQDERVCVLGESIEDPYGGAFKVTKGLSEAFPGRVFDTPISEAGLTGLAGGMALRGLRPVLEIMFGDFTTLCVDQLVNSLCKFPVMYGDPVDVPLVVRTPMGGRRGYGPTHSQTLEKLFLGVPNLNVVAPSHVHDARALLRQVVLAERVPTLFVEHKLLYAERVWDDAWAAEQGFTVRRAGAPYETVTLLPAAADAPDASLFVYGGMAPLALSVARKLFDQEEVAVEVVLPSRLAPLDVAPLAKSLRASRRGVVAEEGTRTAGWGAEVCARLYEEVGLDLDAPLVRVGARDQTLPSCKALELEMLPDEADLEAAIVSLL